jgi:hypothetical protein
VKNDFGHVELPNMTASRRAIDGIGWSSSQKRWQESCNHTTSPLPLLILIAGGSLGGSLAGPA